MVEGAELVTGGEVAAGTNEVADCAVEGGGVYRVDEVSPVAIASLCVL